jgi:RimJ/RimL family protein N-acetyltransferase
MLSIRKVEEKDICKLFEWANDSYYRSMSKDTSQIQWEAHERWFSSVALKNPYFYIFTHDSSDIGLVRFDYAKSTDRWFVTIYLTQEMRGKGYGKEMLRQGTQDFLKEKERVFAEVHSKNEASLKIFLACGFNILEEKTFYLLEKRSL